VLFLKILLKLNNIESDYAIFFLYYICMFHVNVIPVYYTATIIQSDVNCKTKWVLLQGQRSNDDTLHGSASTLVECQKACKFDPRCVAVDWRSNDRACELNTDPNHDHHGNDKWDHYDLSTRCSITSGECLTVMSSLV